MQNKEQDMKQVTNQEYRDKIVETVQQIGDNNALRFLCKIVKAMAK